jgi:hypothetical protein
MVSVLSGGSTNNSNEGSSFLSSGILSSPVSLQVEELFWVVKANSAPPLLCMELKCKWTGTYLCRAVMSSAEIICKKSPKC